MSGWMWTGPGEPLPPDVFPPRTFVLHERRGDTIRRRLLGRTYEWDGARWIPVAACGQGSSCNECASREVCWR